MKKLLAFLVFFSFPLAGVAKDIVKWQSQVGQGEAIVTDEPCSEKVLTLLRAGGINEELLKLLKRARALPAKGEPFEACVLPADEDGDYPIADEKGGSGYLNHENLVPLNAPARVLPGMQRI
jgi:hypothetical protein